MILHSKVEELKDALSDKFGVPRDEWSPILTRVHPDQFPLKNMLNTMTNNNDSPAVVLEQYEIGQYFHYDHLPERLQKISKPFHDMAVFIINNTKPNKQQELALQKVLEAKDCAVRAAL